MVDVTLAMVLTTAEDTDVAIIVFPNWRYHRHKVAGSMSQAAPPQHRSRFHPRCCGQTVQIYPSDKHSLACPADTVDNHVWAGGISCLSF